MKLTAHIAFLAALLALNWVLPTYQQGVVARIMVLATYAAGYNILFGYTGLLSLGHAMFFAAGIYGFAMPVFHLNWPPELAFPFAILCGAGLGLTVGLLALRTIGVAFMIVTLMFSQTVFYIILYFTRWTRGEEGIVLQAETRALFNLDITDPTTRYLVAFTLFATVLLITLTLVQRPFGRTLIAIRENEDRASLLGYDIHRHKLLATILSATISAAAGATFAMLFGSNGSTYAAVQYSILPLLWVLLGGAGTVIGPILGTVFMFYLIDYADDITDAYMLIAGAALVLLTLFAPTGIAGLIRKHIWRGLP